MQVAPEASFENSLLRVEVLYTYALRYLGIKIFRAVQRHEA
jgi:hypothetical protein